MVLRTGTYGAGTSFDWAFGFGLDGRAPGPRSPSFGSASPWAAEDQAALGTGLPPELLAALPALYARALPGPTAGAASGFPGAERLDGDLAALILAFLISKLGELQRGRDLGALSGGTQRSSGGGGGGGSASGGGGGSASGGGAPVSGAAPTTPVSTSPGLPPGQGLNGLKVEVIGDSLMVGAADKTKAALSGAGAAGVDIDAQVGRSISASGGGNNLSPQQIRERVEASGANVVVMELGTNHADYARFIPETMNELSKIQPPPTVVWVNTQTQRPEPSSYGQAYYDDNAKINQLIAAEAARRPNMVVADWASIAGGPGINAGDGLHLTGAGSQALADLILKTIAAARPG